MFNAIDLETMFWVNRALNPHGLANPGKIFPTPRTCGEAAMAQKSQEFKGVDRF
jgi:glycolate oxidase